MRKGISVPAPRLETKLRPHSVSPFHQSFISTHLALCSWQCSMSSSMPVRAHACLCCPLAVSRH